MGKNRLWKVAKRAALRVEFLDTREELFSYANAIYSAMMWGRKADEEKIAIQVRHKLASIRHYKCT